MKRVYLDYASLTPTDPDVLSSLKMAYSDKYANPGALYQEGVNAKKLLDQSRKKVAQFLNAHKDEITFTSGGTESNNLAIMGVVKSEMLKGRKYEDMHFITSDIEHSSVKNIFEYLKKMGAGVDILPTKKDGTVNTEGLFERINPKTILISVMYVNNETGVIQPIPEIIKIIRRARKILYPGRPLNSFSYPILHSDCSQAIYEELNMEKMGIDLLTLDGAKTYGPKGIGLLYIRRNVRPNIEGTMIGGGQENDLRSGTENIPAICGFAKSLDLIFKSRNKEYKRLAKIKEYFIKRLTTLDNITVNGLYTSPHILNVTIKGLDAEFAVFQLDAKGIACSTKSSCLKDEDESYVLKAMGVDSKETLRFSFGRWTKKSDIDAAIVALNKVIKNN